MSILDEFTGENDVTSVREVPLKNGNILRAYRTDPYGFICFKLDKGQLPDWMKGSYTSYSEAQKAIQQYMSLKDMEAVEEISSKKFDRKEKT
mgnify:CR=1 FL=1